MPRLLLLLAVLIGCAAHPAPASTQARPDTANLPKVVVIATGGTIAGVQSAPGTLGEYRAGTLTAEQIIRSVPELSRHARIETEQFSNVASTLITPQQWIGLSRRIHAALSREDVAGVVVTHGTDRLEETAFFLYLTVRSEKPVAVVGAQRPATGISPDGPVNLLSAVRTVVSPQAVGKGVLVVMDDRILSARESRKHYQRVGGFEGGDMGTLGIVGNGDPEFFFAPVRRRGPRSEFDVLRIDSLPAVDLTVSYPGGRGPRYDTLPAGIVVTTTGFTRAEQATFRQLRQRGVVVVTAFPSGDNVAAGRQNPPSSDSTRVPVTPEDSARVAERNAPPTVGVQHLTPQKARILLMLALTITRDPVEIQRMFREY
ncbi:asparaginase [Pseudogemmatithrix spongiicola]|uniref:Asparaginase n=1 Tax=Pseudogemmatithrix spongiicola TaxID=3062599 RepID=A0AA49K0W9_9BACT|nr:asparaginase [Gemmatimonadaceae bacterium 'strain 138']WKW15646.1 asparaginase [Gemmatimonadaceae bacterium 'strain 318']